jgi:hypothetical protein
MLHRVGDFRDYMTLSETAAELAVSKSRVEQYVRDGRLAVAVRAGGVRFVLRSDVVRLKRTPRRPPGRPASTASRLPE